MSEPLRVLFVEDSGDDAELEMIQLRQSGFEVIHDRVCSADDLKAVIGGPWQVIIADYNMPTFTGLDALAIWRERRPEIPFILVSGSLGEDRAVEALKAGAHDYLMKDNLRRLGPAVVRALRETAAQRARARANAFESLLARASALLGESLDYELTLKRVAALAVPEFADWCVVDVLDDRGVLQPLAMAHAEPDKVRAIETLWRRYPSRPDAALGPARVVRRGPELIAAFSPEKLREVAPEAEQRALLDQLALRSYIGVPLRARGAALGALTLVSSRVDRAYDAVDLSFAEELARRAAFAVDNARMYARTQDAVRLRDDFLSVASHELRTPLTTLQLQLQSLLAAVEKGQRETTPRDEAKLRRAVRSTERLSDLVDTLVDVSRIASGSLPISRVPVDLNTVAHKVVRRYADEAQRVGSTLVVKEGAPAIVGQWDRERVEQMLGNLLSNALKYGAGQPIEIALALDEGWAEMTVRDRGMGIAPADLERIFGRFERAVSVRNYGGLGLGLYITREIAESHGGSVRADSRPGEGAAFTIRLPLQPPPRDPPPIP